MKRIQSACICQTLHFQLKEDEVKEVAVKKVQQEVAAYKSSLVSSRTQHRIISEETRPDGSVIVKIIKQYNSCPVGNYLD